MQIHLLVLLNKLENSMDACFELPEIMKVFKLIIISQYKWAILVITCIWGEAEDKG